MKPKLHEGLPLFNMEVDPTKQEEGMNFISLVKNPATEQPFFKFFEQKKETGSMTFAVTSAEKKILTGVVMLADSPIYRKDEEGNEFYVQFPKDVVEKMAFKYMKDQFTKRVNVEHDAGKIVDGVYLVESYIFDEDRGIKLPEFLGKVSPGSWIASFKVDNEEVWNKAKEGEFEGFSLEGNFGLNEAFSKKELQNELKSRILDENLSVNQKYNAIIEAVKNA